MINKFNAYPRLTRSEALKKLNDFSSHTIEELSKRINDIKIENYHFSPIIGPKLTLKQIRSIRDQMIDIAKKINYPNKPSPDNLKKFDISFTKFLYENLIISPNEASKNEIWNFITCDVVPDLVKWRFFLTTDKSSKEALIDRYLGGRRNTFQRLWWRGFTFNQLIQKEEKYSFLNYLFSDDMRELEERTNLYGIRKLTRSIAFEYISLKKNKISELINHRDILRDVIKNTLRNMSWMAYECLDQEEISHQVKSIFNKSILNFDKSLDNEKIKISQKDKIVIDLNEKEQHSSIVKLEDKSKLLKLAEDGFKTSFEAENNSKSVFYSKKKNIRIIALQSKRYEERKNQKYWYSVTSNHLKSLTDEKNSYLILGMSDKNYCFIFPLNWFLERKELFNRSLYDYGSKFHIYIEDESGENYIIRSKDENTPLENIQNYIFPQPEFDKNEINSKPIQEQELIKPAVDLIKEYGKRGISTSDLIRELRLVLKPKGEDTRKLKGRSDDKFSQKVRNLKSHRKLEKTFENISFLNDRYYWVNNLDIEQRVLELPKSIEWRSEHFIKIIKEKLPLSGGEKAQNQWNLLKSFDSKTILEYQDEASKRSLLKEYKYSYHNSKNDLPWWEQELLFCIKKRLIKITDEYGKEINLN